MSNSGSYALRITHYVPLLPFDTSHKERVYFQTDNQTEVFIAGWQERDASNPDLRLPYFHSAVQALFDPALRGAR